MTVENAIPDFPALPTVDSLAEELDQVAYSDDDPTINANPKTVKGKVFTPPIGAIKQNGGKPAAAKGKEAVKKDAADVATKPVGYTPPAKDTGKVKGLKADKAPAPKGKSAKKTPVGDEKKADESVVANRKPAAKITVERIGKPVKQAPAVLQPHGLAVIDVNNTLAEASQMYRITSVGLIVTGEPTLEDHKLQGQRLMEFNAGMTWAVVDWVLDGEQRFGEDFYQIADALGMQVQSVNNLTSSLSKYTYAERVPGVSPSIHQEVAYVQDKVKRQQILLDYRSGKLKNLTEVREAKNAANGKPPAQPKPNANGDALRQDVDGIAPVVANAPKPVAPQNVLQQLDPDGDGLVDVAAEGGNEQWLILGTWGYVHDKNGVLFYENPDQLDDTLAKLVRAGRLEGRLKVTISVLAE